MYNEPNAQQYKAVKEEEKCSRFVMGRSLYKNMLTNRETPSRELCNEDGICAVHKSQDNETCSIVCNVFSSIIFRICVSLLISTVSKYCTAACAYATAAVSNSHIHKLTPSSQ